MAPKYSRPPDRSSPRCGHTAEAAATVPSSSRARSTGSTPTSTLASAPVARSALGSTLCHIGPMGPIGPIGPMRQLLPVVRRHERRHIWRRPGLAAAEVPRRALAEELREPRLVFDLLVQDGGADRVGAGVLALGELAQVGVAADGAALGLDQDSEQIL